MTVKLLNDNATCTKNKQIHKGANKSIGSKAFPVYSSLIPQLSSSIPRKIPHSVMPNGSPLGSQKNSTKTNSKFLHTRTLPKSYSGLFAHIHARTNLDGCRNGLGKREADRKNMIKRRIKKEKGSEMR